MNRGLVNGAPVLHEAERGSITVLSIGFLAICLALVMVVTEASAAFLDRRDLASVCDGAALAASQAVADPGSARPGVPLTLDPGAADAALRRYRSELALAGDRAAANGSLVLSVTVNPGGASVTARCLEPLRLPGIAYLGIDPSRLPAMRASSTAEMLVS